LAPFGGVIWKAIVLEIIDERSKPISLFNNVRGDGVDFTLF
jgi:hypothetical protein